MSKVLSGGKLAGGNSSVRRVNNDFYATDPETVKLFLNEFHKGNQLEGDILECACGQGHIAKVLEEVYPNSKIIGTDLVDRGYGSGNIDFLSHNFNRKFGTVITNPPFKFAKEFIEKSLEVSEKYVIMYCKIQLLEGISRKEMFEKTPLKYIYVHSSRQSIFREGEPLDPKTGKKWANTMCFAWFVWDKEYSGEPIVRWI